MTVDDIIKKAETFIEHSKINNKKLTDGNLEKDEFISVLSDDITEYTNLHTFCNFLMFISPSEEIKKVCNAADERLSEYINQLNLDKKIYSSIVEFYSRQLPNLDIDDQIFFKKVIHGYEKNGIKLSGKKQEKLLRVKKEIAKLEQLILDFIIKSDNKMIALTQEDFNGLPQNFKKKLPIISKNPLRYGVQFNKYTYINCMRHFRDGLTRKNLELCYSAKCADIVQLISKLVVLRDKHAKLLSYPNHTIYKNGENRIKDVLINLLHKIDYRYVKEMDTLSKIKKIDTGDSKINSWDLHFYINRWKKDYGVDDGEVRMYFPIEHVVKNIFKIYEELFRIRIQKIDKKLWHKSVRLYAVNRNNKPIGYFFLDIFSRKNKPVHTQSFVLQTACKYLGRYQRALVALVSSYDHNSLLNHSDVVLLFHEFSHVVHHIFGKNRHSICSVDHNFIEVPALALDYLCWEKKYMRRLSSHWKTGESLPDHLIDKLVKIRDIDIGIHYKKHILISIYDQLIHSSDTLIKSCETNIKGKKDDLMPIFTNLYRLLHQQILCSQTADESRLSVGYNDGMMFPGLWINYIHGGDAKHYYYIWSKIYAADIYSHYKDNPEKLGEELLDKVFRFGDSRDPVEMLTSLINKKPSINGFIKLHNLDYDVEYSFFINTEKIENHSSESSETEEYSNRFCEVNASDVATIRERAESFRERIRNENESDGESDTEAQTLGRYKNLFIKKY